MPPHDLSDVSLIALICELSARLMRREKTARAAACTLIQTGVELAACLSPIHRFRCACLLRDAADRLEAAELERV